MAACLSGRRGTRYALAMHANAQSDIDSLRHDAASGAPDAQFRLAAQLVAMGDAHEAFDLYRQAAERGHLPAKVEYARMQLFGVACEPDPMAAVHWLERAERGGSAPAASLLASIALGGIVMD